ncbi:unnamed protein product [Prorocentrum cordatum]|uniref:Uncharacterized protein n=1 Tax=Prorocentrum cordatum TaxID=2364126 RepID=A0ABN9TML1_9DINO|nr:unnamed protein product [Polarella glacialis]
MPMPNRAAARNADGLPQVGPKRARAASAAPVQRHLSSSSTSLKGLRASRVETVPARTIAERGAPEGLWAGGVLAAPAAGAVRSARGGPKRRQPRYIEENSLPSCSKAGKIARGRANKLVVEEPRERSLHVIIRAFKHSSAEAQSPRGKRAKLEHLLAMACCRRAPAAARPAGRGRVGGGPGRETERCRHQPCERRNVWVASRGGREASIARVGGGLWLAGGAREVGGGDGGGPPNKTGGLLNRTKPHSEPRSRPLRETLGEDPRKGAVSIEPLPRSGRASCLKVF